MNTIIPVVLMMTAILSTAGVGILSVVVYRLKAENFSLQHSLTLANENLDNLFNDLIQLDETKRGLTTELSDRTADIERYNAEKESFITYHNAINHERQQLIIDLQVCNSLIDSLRSEIEHVRTNRMPRGLQRKQTTVNAQIFPINTAAGIETGST